MRALILVCVLLLPGCARSFGAPFENRTQALDESLKHVEMARTERLDAVVYIGDPMSVAWLCTQVGATGSPRGCQFYADREGLADPVVIVPRDSRTGSADPVVLVHELCHARGGAERDCLLSRDR